MAHIINRNIDGREVLKVITEDLIELNGFISGHANVKFISESNSVTINNFMNGHSELLAIADGNVVFQNSLRDHSSAKLISKNGDVYIGNEDIANNFVITNEANVSIEANKDVRIFLTIINSNSPMSIVSKNGSVKIVGEIRGNASISIISEKDIVIQGNITDRVHLDLISTKGSIIIGGQIHHSPTIKLTASKQILINNFIVGNTEDWNHPQPSVVARCEGDIIVNGGITVKSYGYIEFRSYNSIRINGNVLIADSAQVKLSASDGPINIFGSIIGRPNLTYWATGRLFVTGSGRNLATESNWVQEYGRSLDDAIPGIWWTNWFWSYGYISNYIYKPVSYSELSILYTNLINAAQQINGLKIKAAGGSWSFSDIILPQDSVEEVNRISIFVRGKNNTIDLRLVLRGMTDANTPMDLNPFLVSRSLDHSSFFEQTERHLRKKVKPGIDLKTTKDNYLLIDTKFICSSLQHNLIKKVHNGKHRYWVEAGITMENLSKLLDHSTPRLAIEASGGSPGATLAGTISTSTHGGEFKKPLLIDRVLAVHLFGADGKEWWIEGSNEVIEKEELQRLFPNITDDHFISRETWSETEYSSDDFLKAVITSLGCLGIIYSVVLEVVPQFSIKQVTYKYKHWNDLLSRAQITDGLVNKSAEANNALLNFLIDGSLNKTGIPLSKNEYMDLAINPISKSCWVVNREFLPFIAEDSKEMDLISNYINSLSNNLTEGETHFEFLGSKLVARFANFLSIPTDGIGSFVLAEINHFKNFARGIQGNSMLLSSLMALFQVKAMWNKTNASGDPLRGHKFLSDILDGVLDALQGTHENPKSEVSGVSSKVGAIGWPSTGLPGRGFEVAVSPNIAFSYINDILTYIDEMMAMNKVFLGYISIRLCPSTNTLMGMQQFSPYSVMVEVVAHRTPESNEIFDGLISFTKNYSGFSQGQFPTFHWGLETEQFDEEYLRKTPFMNPYRGNLTKIDLFKRIKNFIRNNHSPVFDNAFAKRMGL